MFGNRCTYLGPGMQFEFLVTNATDQVLFTCDMCFCCEGLMTVRNCAEFYGDLLMVMEFEF